MPGFYKVVNSYAAALSGLQNNMTIMVGGFGLCGIPEGLIKQIYVMGTSGLTCISNNAGIADFGLGILLAKQQIKKLICSYVGENAPLEHQYLDGKIEIVFTPQGTLAEKIRAGGAGIPAFFTPTGYGTIVATDKEIREFQGKSCILETALTADFSLVKAWKADSAGNLIYRKTARNFNPLMATAGKITIAEVEEIVPVGTLDPDHIGTPGIYVDRIICGTFEKRVEQRTMR